ncbi:hypothetical protein ACHAWF_015664 [Thalassiosira exigua]
MAKAVAAAHNHNRDDPSTPDDDAAASYSPKDHPSERRLLPRWCRPVAMTSSVRAWAALEKNGLKDFGLAQCKVAAVLALAHVGNVWEPAYPRNDNHAPPTFWLVNAFLAVGTYLTWTRREGGPGRKVAMLGRDQTEEWKGWMQWGFVFYHYYRVYYVYNEIRVFVSAYVWMVSFARVSSSGFVAGGKGRQRAVLRRALNLSS